MPARFRAVKTRPLAFLLFPSRTCQTRRRKAGPSGQPALSGGGAGPEGRRPGRRQAAGPAPPRARATSRGCSWEFTPLPPASPGGGGPRGYRGGVGSARGPPRRLLTLTGMERLRGVARSSGSESWRPPRRFGDALERAHEVSFGKNQLLGVTRNLQMCLTSAHFRESVCEWPVPRGNLE